MRLPRITSRGEIRGISIRYIVGTYYICLNYDVKQRFQQNCYKLCGEHIPELAVASLGCRGGGDITYKL